MWENVPTIDATNEYFLLIVFFSILNNRVVIKELIMYEIGVSSNPRVIAPRNE